MTRWRVGDTVGVGCFVDSCRECEACGAGEEQYCADGMTLTYNGRERGSAAPTYGGYSTRITVDQDYVVRVPEGIPLARAAPLLCAGITTYSPLKHFGLARGDDAGDHAGRPRGERDLPSAGLHHAVGHDGARAGGLRGDGDRRPRRRAVGTGCGLLTGAHEGEDGGEQGEAHGHSPRMRRRGRNARARRRSSRTVTTPSASVKRSIAWSR